MRSPLHSLHSNGSGLTGDLKQRHGIEGIAESLMNRASLQQNLKCITNSLSAAVTDLIPHDTSNGQYHLTTDEYLTEDGRMDVGGEQTVIGRETVSIRNSHRKMPSVSIPGKENSDNKDMKEDLKDEESHTVMADSTCQSTTGSVATVSDDRNDYEQKSPDLEEGPSNENGNNALGLLSDIADALQRGHKLYRDVKKEDSERSPSRNYDNHLSKEVSSDYSTGYNSRDGESTETADSATDLVNHHGRLENTDPAYMSGPSSMTGYNLPDSRGEEEPSYSGSLLQNMVHGHQSARQQSAIGQPNIPLSLATGLQANLPPNLLAHQTMMLQQHLQSLGLPAATGALSLPPSLVKQEGSGVLSPLFMSPLTTQLANMDGSTPSPPQPQSSHTSGGASNTKQITSQPPTPHNSTTSTTPTVAPTRTRSGGKGNTGNKKWQCMFCGIMVSSKFYLSSHVNAVHTRTRVYPCELCGKVFYSHGAQRIHKLRNHWVEKRHKCPHCSQLFVLPFEMRQHVQRKHKNIVAAK